MTLVRVSNTVANKAGALVAVIRYQRMTLFIGDIEVQLLYLARAHSPSNSVAWLPQSRTLSTGDLLFNPRHAQVAELAEMETEFAASTTSTTSTAGSAVEKAVGVVEQYPGTGSTDFWDISIGFSAIDHGAMSGEALERELALILACWLFPYDVRRRVSTEMQKGLRGGGRDRDRIARHVSLTERDWARMLGVARI